MHRMGRMSDSSQYSVCQFFTLIPLSAQGQALPPSRGIVALTQGELTGVGIEYFGCNTATLHGIQIFTVIPNEVRNLASLTTCRLVL